MVADWNEPDNSSLYTDVLADLNAKILSCVLLDPSADSNIPDNAFMIDQADGNSLKQYDLGGDTWSLVNFKVDDFTCDDITAATLAATSITVTTANTTTTNASTLNLGTFSDTGASDGFEATAPYIRSSRDTTSEVNHLLLYNPNGLVGEFWTQGDDIGISAPQSSFTAEAAHYFVIAAGTQIQMNGPTQVNNQLQQGTFSTTGASRGSIFPSGGGYLQMSNSNTSTYNHLSFYNSNGLLGLISTSGNDFSIESTVDSMTLEAQDELYLLAASNIRLNASAIIIDAGYIASDVNVGVFSSTGASRGFSMDEFGYFFQSNSSASSYNNQNFYNTNGLVGRINTNGSATNYITSSDYRLKENQKSIEEAVLILEKIPFYEFNFKANPEEKIFGVFAHELEAIIPHAVTGEKDAVDERGNIEPQGVDYGKLTPIIGAALQQLIKELREKGHIENLKEKANEQERT